MTDQMSRADFSTPRHPLGAGLTQRKDHPMTDTGITAASLLTERRDFLNVRVGPAAKGGFDVLVRFDGTYSRRQDAEEAAQGIRAWFEALSDVPKDRWYMWKAPHETESNPNEKLICPYCGKTNCPAHQPK